MKYSKITGSGPGGSGYPVRAGSIVTRNLPVLHDSRRVRVEVRFEPREIFVHEALFQVGVEIVPDAVRVARAGVFAL